MDHDWRLHYGAYPIRGRMKRRPVEAPAPYMNGISDEHQPATGSAACWPLVLYFHHVHPEILHYTALTPQEFERGLKRVLEEFDAYLPSGLIAEDGPHRPDRPTVLITFDDGYRDTVTYARPILDRLGIRAVFFVCTGLVGRRSQQPRQDYLTYAECDLLAADGHLIAAHTRTHPHLDEIPANEAREEALGSLADIDSRYGSGPTRLFAYPYGRIPGVPGLLPSDVLGFGTVRSPAEPWPASPHAIRRTYLPSGGAGAWDGLVDHWRTQWSSTAAAARPGWPPGAAAGAGTAWPDA
ncbi:polysaccharide deacetylase family protein [Streptomyces sp. HB132]|uniref:polysaccharide deacetylase family protein n=1 Tax=Streptomyces sp. HB132 TaxID=767388 RepID=UPI00196134D3|nr:polysaccharide deacetylase family protein [Streptomyces sp. HB132]MBM7443039.1 peptidoglycan/xylan/chitin deacetylase (PgdA/CDA1 family) [Streptomyces sp. HB132]